MNKYLINNKKNPQCLISYSVLYHTFKVVNIELISFKSHFTNFYGISTVLLIVYSMKIILTFDKKSFHKLYHTYSGFKRFLILKCVIEE